MPRGSCPVNLLGYMLEGFSILYQLSLFVVSFLPLYSTPPPRERFHASNGPQGVPSRPQAPRPWHPIEDSRPLARC